MVGSDSRAGLTPEQRKQLGTGNAAGQPHRHDHAAPHRGGPNLLMSIPRDSLVDIPGHGTTKINAAYAYGYADGGADGGAKLLVRTIEAEHRDQDRRLRRDRARQAGQGGRRRRRHRDLPDHRHMKDKLANLEIEKGCQVDSTTALGYARSRHTSGIGDIDRVKHQREVVAAVGDKACRRGRSSTRCATGA